MDAQSTPTPPGGTIDLNDDAAVGRWIDYFGITRTQLEEAVKSAGTDPQAVQQHLLNQGASSGAS
ncbi:DUF3606 domain-containing protein [Azohydromonas caseinilytica]|uniref:DUF3606 domain-containing protein n=1 Tax=Azohydromonas caseinilytica TaxID=2728836 RepID=A0A848FG91_9BURK|nr:DUF3606 domain-containing protein [Azohydromonas caseinilytica]NML17273.1 DUF3606 domain-containing protein [Azohydromonas caseinilytica]